MSYAYPGRGPPGSYQGYAPPGGAPPPQQPPGGPAPAGYPPQNQARPAYGAPQPQQYGSGPPATAPPGGAARAAGGPPNAYGATSQPQQQQPYGAQAAAPRGYGAPSGPPGQMSNGPPSAAASYQAVGMAQPPLGAPPGGGGAMAPPMTAPAGMGGSGGAAWRPGGPPPPLTGQQMPPPPPQSVNSPSSSNRPPPPAGPGGTRVQFYSMGGGAPTPTAPAGPPTGGAIPPPISAGPPQVQPPTGQFGQMSLGPPPPSAGGVAGGYGGGGMAPGVGAQPGGYPMAAGNQAAPTTPGGGRGAAYGQQAGGWGGSGGGGVASAGPMSPGGAGLSAAVGAAGHSQLPNAAETDFTIQADPRFMCMTVSEIPNSSNAHAQTKLPLGVVIQPMAKDLEEPEGGLQVVNFGTQGIIRCKRCRTYINPYVAWLNNGRQWRCNVCGMVNDVPTSYFCHLDANGQRRDKDQRPELSQASVELVAPAEYMVRAPQPPVYLFVIDVSAPAVACGMVGAAIATIRACLDSLPGGERTQVGFVTFDASVHFYNLKSTLSQPQMLVVSDLTDLFLPCPEDLLANLTDSRKVIESLLEALPGMFQSSRNVECCLGSALTAAGRAMAHIGGKMVVFCASLPSAGEARLKHRDNPRLLGTDKEHLLLKPEDPWYQAKAVDFSKWQICVDLFLCSAQYTDVATLVQLPKFAGGQLFYYPAFQAPRDSERMHVDLSRVLTRPTAFEAVIRVRATRGLRINNFFGNYYIRGTDLLALPNCTSDSVFGVEFGYDEQVLTASVICVQSALLYTTSGGERRIRVHNIALPVTSLVTRIFQGVQVDVLCNIIAKQALEVALKTGLDAARARIQQCCVEIVRASKGGGAGVGMVPGAAYGGPGGAYGHAQQQQQQGGRDIPEAIQLLPLYSMALQKSPALRGGAEVRPDERAYYMSMLANMSFDHSRCFIYPRMFSLQDLPAGAGDAVPDSLSGNDGGVAGADEPPTAGISRRIRLPNVVNLSAERLTSDGAFLLEDALALYLWVGRGFDSNLTMALFGVPSLEGVDTSSLALRTDTNGSGNDYCRRVSAVVAALREERNTFLPLHVMTEGDGQNEYRFFWHLVEDRAAFAGGNLNYAEYMQHISRAGYGALG